MKTGKNKKWMIAGVFAVLLLAAYLGFGKSYIQRHFVTNHADENSSIAGEKVVHDKKVLTVYFTRVGNSAFEPDVQAVSGASLVIDDDKLIGNSELLGKMIQDAAGGDLFAIRTEEKYPSSYGETTMVARTEKQQGIRPVLVGELPDMSQYDTVFLIHPIWWNTIPMPVVSFLEQAGLRSDMTIYPVATHGGSKAGNSNEDIRKYCEAKVAPSFCVMDDDVKGYRGQIGDMVKDALNPGKELP